MDVIWCFVLIMAVAVYAENSSKDKSLKTISKTDSKEKEVDDPHVRTKRGYYYSTCRHPSYSNADVMLLPGESLNRGTTRAKDETTCTSFCKNQRGCGYTIISGQICSFIRPNSILAMVQSSTKRFHNNKWCRDGYCEPFTSRLCRDGNGCVQYSNVCDGTINCADASDEAECFGNSTASLFHHSYGLVILNHLGMKVLVCTDNNNWTHMEAGVMCRSLGFIDGTVLQYEGADLYPQTWLSTVHCRGREKNLFECSYERGNCSSHKPAAATCY